MRLSTGVMLVFAIVSSSTCVDPQDMPVTPEITTESLEDGVVGSPYSGQLRAYGGTGPYTWSLENVPEELNWLTVVTVDSTIGKLGGNPPETQGSFTFRARVTDSKGRTSFRDLSLAVKGCTPNAEIVCYHAEGGQCRENARLLPGRQHRDL